MNENLLTPIVLRKALATDVEAIFKWRNAPETRAYSFNKNEISWIAHQEWYHSILLDETKIILIAELNHQPLGVLRYDIEHEKAEVSVYLVPGFQGQGLGTTLLTVGTDWLSQYLPCIKKIIAKITAENIGSQKAFKKAGFKEFYSVYELVISQ